MKDVSKAIWAIDLDRTLLNSERVYDAIAEIAVQSALVKPRAIDVAKRQTEARHKSFDIIGFLGKTGVRSDEIDGLCATFTASAVSTDLLYPDSLPFLQALDAADQPSIIVTQGGRDGQFLKLQASQLTARPYLITDRADKGKIYRQWQDGATCTAVSDERATLTGDTVVAVDDKYPSFEGFPTEFTGYLIERPDEKRSPRPAELPPNITLVTDLASILQLDHRFRH